MRPALHVIDLSFPGGWRRWRLVRGRRPRHPGQHRVHPRPRDETPTVRLLPGKSAHATISIPDWQNFPEDRCKPVSVRGFRVYPPDETASAFVSQPQKACSIKGQGVGGVAPITLATS